MKQALCTVGVTAVCLTWAASAAAQPVADHLKCFKVKDALNLAGTVDLDTPQFGADPGCTISKAKLFCVPATKTNVTVTDKSTGAPITPLPVGGPNPGDRICYKIKCPTAVPDQQVTDQFGARTLSKFKASLLCTPAVQGVVAAAYASTCAVATCSAEGDLCEPCDGGGNCHPS